MSRRLLARAGVRFLWLYAFFYLAVILYGAVGAFGRDVWLGFAAGARGTRRVWAQRLGRWRARHCGTRLRPRRASVDRGGRQKAKGSAVHLNFSEPTASFFVKLGRKSKTSLNPGMVRPAIQAQQRAGIEIARGFRLLECPHLLFLHPCVLSSSNSLSSLVISYQAAWRKSAAWLSSHRCFFVHLQK